MIRQGFAAGGRHPSGRRLFAPTTADAGAGRLLIPSAAGRRRRRAFSGADSVRAGTAASSARPPLLVAWARRRLATSSSLSASVPKKRPLSTSSSAASPVASDDDDEENAIRMSDYTYDLDPSSIALYPASPRGSSKLLCVGPDGTVTHHPRFDEAFPGLVREMGGGREGGAQVVFNESRVLNARLWVRGAEGEGGEGDDDDDRPPIEMMILDAGELGGEGSRCVGAVLKVMVRRVGVKVGDAFREAGEGSATFEVVSSEGLWEEDEQSQGNGTECHVRISRTNDPSFLTVRDLLDSVGTVPIPPYLNRDAEESDEEAYNNVYAAAVGMSGGGGSVAAPTAGLHFTDNVLRQLGPDNVSYLSLHVGAGTFKPVVTADARDHEMHAERFRVDRREIRRIVEAMEDGKPLIAVGTTSSRTLESLYWCGVRRLRGLDKKAQEEKETFFTLGQEEWIALLEDGHSDGISAPEALRSLLDDDDKDDDGAVLAGSTSLMIVPGRYEFRVVNALVTNFHAPDSTLMLLVSAFLGSGEKVRSVYEEAAERGYRFLSYGDACMFSRPNR